MKLYQQIALLIRTNKRAEVENILPDGITLHFNSHSKELKLNATHEGIEFVVIVTPDFITGFSLGWQWGYHASGKFEPIIPHLKHIFTELLNQENY